MPIHEHLPKCRASFSISSVGSNAPSPGKDAQSISPTGEKTTFAEFAEYLVHDGRYDASRYNEHWAPMVDLCQPCLVRWVRGLLDCNLYI